MQKSFSRRRYIRIISFFVSLTVLLSAFAAVNGVRAHRYKLAAATAHSRALSELCENLDSLTVSLQKGLYSSSPEMLAQIGSELSRCSACAKVSIGQLTESETVTDEIYKFLSQAGDFTAALSRKASAGVPLSPAEKDGLSKLYEYSRSLSAGAGALRDGYYDKTVSFERELLASGEEKAAYFTESANDTEQALSAYPTLLYDGPFSDSRLNRDAAFLKDKSEITAEQAKETAARLLGAKPSELHRDSDESSKIALFCFSKDGREAGITKKGGYLCYITNPEYSGAAVISEKEAVKRGLEFLKKCGYDNMKDSYYSVYDGICTVNYAYAEDGVIYYSDLIKVSVALDSGNICAADARAYLTNHCKRSLPEKKITEEKARSLVSKNLEPLEIKTAVIPTKYGGEKLCYEVRCRDGKKQEALIYINAETGAEEDILLLLYSDRGVLTR